MIVVRTAPFSVVGHPLSNVCIALLSTLPPSIHCIRVRLLRVRSTAYLRDTESRGLGALDDMLADRVRFPNLQHVDIVVNGPEKGIRGREATVGEVMPRLTAEEALIVYSDPHI